MPVKHRRRPLPHAAVVPPAALAFSARRRAVDADDAFFFSECLFQHDGEAPEDTVGGWVGGVTHGRGCQFRKPTFRPPS